MARRLPALLLLLVSIIVALPRIARADQPGGHAVPVAVLALDSEDAEDNAESFTAALKSKVRQAPGWSLIDTSQSLGMLTAALKCPAHPTPECETKIADQIKAERYIYGFVSKGPQQGQVTVEIHLFQRGKPDTIVKESYSDNLKDGNDDSLKKIAGRVVERLGGSAVGIVVVRAPGQEGEVVVDGEKHVLLKEGAAKIELSGGGHAIELAPTNGAITKRNVLVTPGREIVVEFTAPHVATEPEKPFPTRKVIGGSLAVVGVGLGIASVLSLVAWSDAVSDGEKAAETARTRNNIKDDNPLAQQPCREYDKGTGSCDEFDGKAKKNSTIAIITGAAGGAALIVGAYLFFSEPKEQVPPSSAAKLDPPKPKVRVAPMLDGVTVFGTF